MDNNNKQATEARLTGFVRWAKLTYEDRDVYEQHVNESGGKYTIDFYPDNEEDVEAYYAAGGKRSSMGNDMFRTPGHKSWKDGAEDDWKNDDPNLGIGGYFQFKKSHNQKNEYYSGPPNVFDWREREGSSKLWAFPHVVRDEDGNPVVDEAGNEIMDNGDGKIWNGSRVAINLSIWGKGPGDERASVKLKSVAVLELADEPERTESVPKF